VSQLATKEVSRNPLVQQPTRALKDRDYSPELTKIIANLHHKSDVSPVIKIYETNSKTAGEFMNRLTGKQIAVIATNGFEESELLVPVLALRNEGAHVDIISSKKEPIRGWKDNEWSKSIKVDKSIDQVSAADYDALLIPGGTLNCDQLRQCSLTVNFVENFFETGRPIAAICHGPQLLIEADVVTARRLTSYASLRTDLENAGVEWVDMSVVVDNGLVTSRTPDDLPEFISKMVEEFEKGTQSEARP